MSTKVSMMRLAVEQKEATENKRMAMLRGHTRRLERDILGASQEHLTRVAMVFESAKNEEGLMPKSELLQSLKRVGVEVNPSLTVEQLCAGEQSEDGVSYVEFKAMHDAMYDL